MLVLRTAFGLFMITMSPLIFSRAVYVPSAV